MSPRGGKREGAGRTSPGYPVHPVTVTISDEQAQTARRLGDGNVSSGVRKALNMAKESRRD